MNHQYQQPSPTRSRDNINLDMEFLDEDRRSAFSWQDIQLATSTAAASAQTLRGVANQSYAFSQGPGLSQTGLRSGHVYPQELGTYSVLEALTQEFLGPSDPYNTNGSFYPYTGDASVFSNFAFDDFGAPSMDDSFLTSMPLPSQPDFFPIQPPYPAAGTGYAFQTIAPATAAQMNVAAPPNRPSGARANARHRTAETRISCTVDGCTKTFRRAGDYRRHMRKHQDPILKCIVDDCDMKFYRLDKLRDHIRQGHKMVL
ncbi:hypothetical protein GT037_003013 [Alternaria burnsii]|uniref:C2H2-type domain-containing protein n=1 Tax=Alternaria burnsii TaxID=1187904 RepID=A0A8H7BDD3_9PLEO|nr:uncharacterized protein GT037_003013 [Alternaria burnsii]KAF7679265.1 hypothetical protein GT037_003013 [Alternaria burnsii]